MTYPFPTINDYGPPLFGRAMAQGFNSGRGPMSPGLEATSARWNAMAMAAGNTPHSVLNQLAPSPIAANLSAPSQRDRLLPNGYRLPNNMNAASAPTTTTLNYLRMDQDAN